VRAEPYRVIVWGPGGVGKACIRELLKRPEFELVGVMGFSPPKVGRDIGELLGLDPVGVAVSGSKNQMLALDADVVLWTGNPFGNMRGMEQELLALLESGKNVIVACGYHYPPRHGREYVDELRAACVRGGTTIFGSGENPGFWLERVATTLTGLCTTVALISIDEYVDVAVGGTNAETLNGVGFGLTVEDIEAAADVMEAMWKSYFYVESMELVAQSIWGESLSDFRVDHEYFLAEEELVLDTDKGDPITMTIAKGKILATSHTFVGFVAGSERMRIRVNWFLGADDAPFEHVSNDVWKLEIEAKPVSLRCQFEAFASLAGDAPTKYRPGDDAAPFMYVTGVPLVQAIPLVVAAEPGYLVPSVFANCVPDFRLLGNRRTLVDTHKYTA
jgi:2,4-diaminopentanoate dehydrogenase